MHTPQERLKSDRESHRTVATPCIASSWGKETRPAFVQAPFSNLWTFQPSYPPIFFSFFSSLFLIRRLSSVQATLVPALAHSPIVVVVLTTSCINSPTNLFSPRLPIDRIRLVRMVRGERELDLFGSSVETGIDRGENEGSNYILSW